MESWDVGRRGEKSEKKRGGELLKTGPANRSGKSSLIEGKKKKKIARI